MGKKDDTQKADSKGAEAANERVQAAVDEETEQGFRGVEVDPTPNEAYTVQGVASGAATPETDEGAADKAAAAVRATQTARKGKDA